MNLHILIIDADAAAAQVTRARIARIVPGATFAVERDPERGWLSAQQHKPDIVLIDPARHRLHCGLLLQLIKEAHPATGVIVLDSAPTPAFRRSMHQLGVDLYLDKASSLVFLGDGLRNTLAGYAAPAMSKAS